MQKRKRDRSSTLGSGRSPGEGHGNPLQYSCLENPLDSGAWWATEHRVTKSQTWVKQLSTHAHRVLHDPQLDKSMDADKSVDTVGQMERYMRISNCVGSVSLTPVLFKDQLYFFLLYCGNLLLNSQYIHLHLCLFI